MLAVFPTVISSERHHVTDADEDRRREGEPKDGSDQTTPG
jgi:hypothetical protein